MAIGLIEIIKKINPNAYKWKLPNHIDVFNVKQIFPVIEDSSDQNANSRTNSLQLGEDDVDQIALEFTRINRSDVSVRTPRKMVTRSQDRGGPSGWPPAHPDS
jgi:hypothetical protein